jgi:hypothetical protein
LTLIVFAFCASFTIGDRLCHIHSQKGAAIGAGQTSGELAVFLSREHHIDWDGRAQAEVLVFQGAGLAAVSETVASVSGGWSDRAGERLDDRNKRRLDQ